jgi:hypothetical protein
LGERKATEESAGAKVESVHHVLQPTRRPLEWGVLADGLTRDPILYLDDMISHAREAHRFVAGMTLDANR